MALDLQSVNSKVFGGILGNLSKGGVVNAIGWFIFAILVVGGVGWWLFTRADKKRYDRIITAHSIINGFFVPSYKDIAKPVKLGKGGFEIIYLKKLKSWKLAHGARVGKQDYHFYIMPDGYWYPGQMSANIYQIDENGGLIPVVTTNPNMRSQYTALEKQIDSLHGDKKSFWDKYGQWVMTIAYVAIIGIFSWLSWREIAQFLGAGSALADKMNALAETMNRLAINLNNGQPNGLVPAH